MGEEGSLRSSLEQTGISVTIVLFDSHRVSKAFPTLLGRFYQD